MYEKTFFLGLGGQKCGSSWMQAYLARQPGSDFGRLGEYQIWESDLGSVFARYRVPEPDWLELTRAEAKRRLGMTVPAQVLRWRMQTNRDEYFRYFKRLLCQSGIRSTGDVTPSYAALPVPILKGIQDGFAAKDIKTRAMFAMRDPVARLRSHMNMEIAKGRVNTGDEAQLLADFYKTKEAASRSRYDLTLGAMEDVFGPEDRFITLFEELFTPKGTARFADWACVATERNAGGKAVNARGSGHNELPDALISEIVQTYRHVYEAVFDRLPKARDLWPSSQYLI
ncbi:MAG: hypothetical protein MK098_12830 [Marinovum sp.]|nr:hypothetical protein [Marinovum sp.]